MKILVVEDDSITLDFLAKKLREVKVDRKCDAYLGIAEVLKKWTIFCPLIAELRDPAMRDRHWTQLMNVTGKSVAVGPNPLGRVGMRSRTLLDCLSLVCVTVPAVLLLLALRMLEACLALIARFACVFYWLRRADCVRVVLKLWSSRYTACFVSLATWLLGLKMSAAPLLRTAFSVGSWRITF